MPISAARVVKWEVSPSLSQRFAQRTAQVPPITLPQRRWLFLPTPPFLHSKAEMQPENPFLIKTQQKSKLCRVRFTFTLLRPISSSWVFLPDPAIRVFCKEISLVLFSGSMNSSIYLWFSLLWWHQGGNTRPGTQWQQAAFLPLLIYCLSESQIPNTRVLTWFQLLSKTKEVFSSSHWVTSSLSRSQAFCCFVWVRRKTLIVPIF